MKRACLLLFPALLLVLATVGCQDESKPSFTRLKVYPTCGVSPLEVEGYAIVSGGDESGEPLGGNNNLEVNWNFGDGGTGRTTIAYHRYDLADDPSRLFTVTVTAKDPQGNTATTSQEVLVLADSLQIEAMAMLPDGGATVADTVQFGFSAFSCDIDYPSVVGDSVKVQYLWSIIETDTTTYAVAEPRYQFLAPGTYDVELTVSYPAWAVTRTDALQVTVGP